MTETKNETRTLYRGTKLVYASPMNRGDYNEYRGWKVPNDENPDDEGYLVEYTDGGKPNDPRHTGYISWSPKDVFDRAYNACLGDIYSGYAFNFSDALTALKGGCRVARSGWNGKGLWLEMQRPDAVSKMTLPYIYINYPEDAKTTPGARVPWFASQTDMLADDWMLVDQFRAAVAESLADEQPTIPHDEVMAEADAIINAKASKAPRVTLADIEAEILSENYFTAAQGIHGEAIGINAAYQNIPEFSPLHRLTFCVLILKNDYMVTGDSCCVSPENFDAELGRKLARENAIEKVWPLLGFRLHDKLAAIPRTAKERVIREKTELDERISKLRDFLNNEKSNVLLATERLDLDDQLVVMANYSAILKKRLICWRFVLTDADALADLEGRPRPDNPQSQGPLAD